MKSSRVRILTECALMVALSAVLQIIPFFSLPAGGSITLASMAPIVLAALRHGPKWGLLTSFACSLLQMLLGGISSPPTETLGWFVLVVLLDYLLAFTCLGLAPLFARPFSSSKAVGPAVGSVAVCFIRFLCHYLSGIIIWGVYAPEGQPVWLYSLNYNGSYMLVETILTTVVVVLLYGPLMRIDKKRPAASGSGK
ncbi:MAG: energy-coupled thiamine transporter ThiT [Provencibacterium sp.]|jgi:thiamine transporter|nr:energy-coupled thiamine transporter ThiT [Provencibacterium sp.]